MRNKDGGAQFKFEADICRTVVSPDRACCSHGEVSGTFERIRKRRDLNPLEPPTRWYLLGGLALSQRASCPPVCGSIFRDTSP